MLAETRLVVEYCFATGCCRGDTLLQQHYTTQQKHGL
jgi:hypothetical protein